MITWMIAKKDPLQLYLFKVSGFCSHNKTQCSLNGHCIIVIQISTADTSSKCQCPTSSDWQPNWHACTMMSERHSRQWNLGYRGSAPLMRYVWKLVCLPLWLLFITVPVLFKVFSMLYKGTFAASCDKYLYYIKIYTCIYIYKYM